MTVKQSYYLFASVEAKMTLLCINSHFVFPQQKAKEAPEKTDEQQTQASDSGLRRRRRHVA